MIKSKKIALILIFLLAIGFFFRFKGLDANYSFWIDETSSASFARAILERGAPVLPSGYSANDYAVHFYLIAASFQIFGFNEFAARFPSVVFGTLTILVMYFLGKQYGDQKVGLLSAFLTAFSVLEIVYSRQARSYQELQFFSILSVIAFFILLKSCDQKLLRLKHFLFLLTAFALSALTHKFGLLFLIAAGLYLIFIRFDILKKYFLRLWNQSQSLPLKITLVTAVIILFLFSLQYFNFYKALRETTLDFWAGRFGLDTQQYFNIVFSHAKYYHSLFWRQYPHITLLAFLGLIIGLIKNFRLTAFFLIFILIQISFVVFRVFPQFVRYVYLIFPVLLVLSSYFLVWFAQTISVNKKPVFTNFFIIIFAFFLVINGNKFSLMPKSYYSLNFDMSEIPEPDFKTIYQTILSKTDLDREKTVIIDNRPDSAEWYLGEGKLSYYLVGPDELEPAWNLRHNIVKDPVSGALYLTTLENLQSIIAQNPRGYIVLEEKSIEYVDLDRELVKFIKNNLKKEVRLEHVPGNNLSIWPIELYSWGIK